MSGRIGELPLLERSLRMGRVCDRTVLFEIRDANSVAETGWK